MNLRTILIIQTNDERDIKCEAYKHDDGKYSGWINHYRNGFLHQELLSTEPIYDSRAEAISEMKKVLTQIMEYDLKSLGEKVVDK